MPTSLTEFATSGDQWTMADLAAWDEKIRALVDDFGLDCFEQEFEVCDHEQMIGYMAYHGMPAHYPHWSFGKSFERQKTLYNLQLSGLPYEMVINSDPSVAYLMRGNSLCLQILTMAHVYAHNDFFKNNFTFRHTEPKGLLNRVKLHSNRARDYIADPSIGLEQVEPVLDACHSLSLQISRNPSVKRLNREELEARLFKKLTKADKPDEHAVATALEQPLLEDEEDLLRLLLEYAPDLSDWERDLIGIARADALYFLPQIETKIINEGWASFWHHQIMNALKLPHDIHMEFMVRHHQVIRPTPGDINPYHLGFMTWRKIAKEALGLEDGHDDGGPLPLLGDAAKDVRELMFRIREVDRDTSFLRQFLDEKLARELDIFEYAPQPSGDLVVTKVADEIGWREVKQTLLAQVGMGSVPVIKATKIDVKQGHRLTLSHEADDRELEPENAKQTLKHLYTLWRRPVTLETKVNGKDVAYECNEDGVSLLD
jgi:stage V sporulation protein R